jgi:hypothetical protein
MKNKEFDTVQMIRAIRNNNYEETKDLTRQELLEWYKKRGKPRNSNSRKATKIQRFPAE